MSESDIIVVICEMPISTRCQYRTNEKPLTDRPGCSYEHYCAQKRSITVESPKIEHEEAT